MRTIANKGEGGLILAIFVRKYYVDDPYVYIFYAFLNNKKKNSLSDCFYFQRYLAIFNKTVCVPVCDVINFEI